MQHKPISLYKTTFSGWLGGAAATSHHENKLLFFFLLFRVPPLCVTKNIFYVIGHKRRATQVPEGNGSAEKNLNFKNK